MKIFAAIVLVLAAVIAALWIMYVRAPAPPDICQHRADLLRAETAGKHDDAATHLLDQYRLGCVKNADTMLRLRGKLVYARHARCVMAATSFADAERC